MFIVRDMKVEEAPQVSDLVMKSFSRFIASDYSDEGRAEIADFARAEKIAERASFGHFTLIAEEGGEIAGMIQVRLPAHVLMLFVDERFHRRGTARALMESAVDRIRACQPEVKSVTLNSSPFAVEAYLRMGFTATGPEKCAGGVVFTPMRLRLE